LVKQGKLIVYAYCLMVTHYHLLAKTPLGELARWIKHLLGCYAQRFNGKHDRVGHLFQGRYKPLLVEEGSYLLNCSRYIHLNPLKSGIVEHPCAYFWSSYPNYVGGTQAVDWVATEPVLRYFTTVTSYREFVEQGSEPHDPFAEAKAGLIYGGQGFVDQVKAILSASKYKGASSTLNFLNSRSTLPSVEAIRNAINGIFDDYSESQRLRVLIYALRSLSSMSLEEIASAVGRKRWSVCCTVRELKQCHKGDQFFAKRFADLLKELGP